MDDELIRVAGLATRVACQRMTPRYLKALSDSIEQVCCLPATFAWDRKATAYAEIVNILADAAADPVLALLARNLPGHLYELIVTAGPAADDIIASSRRQLLALIRARDADGAGREMEQHLAGLSWTVERHVLEATMNAPGKTGSRRQADPRPRPHQEGNDVTGVTAAIFTPVRRRASGTKG
jgi:DNA-binding FadR family transcriptional regulator